MPLGVGFSSFRFGGGGFELFLPRGGNSPIKKLRGGFARGMVRLGIY